MFEIIQLCTYSSFRNKVTYKLFADKSYIYKQGLALDN